MTGNYRENITRGSIWVRLIAMIIMAIAFNVAEFVLVVVVIFQFIASLVTGHPNDRLARLGRNLARYIQQIIQFLTFANEERPFPFSSWPNEPHQPVVTEPAPVTTAAPSDTPTGTQPASQSTDQTANPTETASAKAESAASTAVTKAPARKPPAKTAATKASTAKTPTAKPRNTTKAKTATKTTRKSPTAASSTRRRKSPNKPDPSSDAG